MHVTIRPGVKDDIADLRDEAARNRRAVLATCRPNGPTTFDLLAPDVTFREAASLPYACEAKGIEAAKTGVAAMMAAWSKIDIEVIEVVATGDYVMTYMYFVCTAKVTGKIYEGPCVEILRFKDGRAVEWIPMYWDTHAVRVACGLT
jgi:ketosteroid isomerase-like protein